MISVKLKQARIDKGYSQEDVSNKLKITRQSISKWENGRGYPDIYNLKLLCNLYEISVDTLLKDDEKFKDISVSKNETEKFEKEAYNKKLETLFMIIVMLVSCLIPFLGIAVSGVVLFHIIKKPAESTISIKLIIIVCLIVSIMNSFTILNDLYFHIGEATII